MANTRYPLYVSAGLLGLLLLASSLFIVSEKERALIIRLGSIVQQTSADGTTVAMELQPGLHIKWPLLDTVRIFDLRLNMHDIKSSRIFTVEKKYVLVDFFVQWRIENLALFYTRTSGYMAQAEKLLEDKVVAGLKAEFGRMTIQDVVSNARAELMERLSHAMHVNAETLGIAVLDVRIKRIELPDEVSESVYSRMRAERERVANEIRSEGIAAATAKRAEADRDRRLLLSSAEVKAKHLRGEGDAQAAHIYTTSAGQASDFFLFYRGLNTYRDVLSDSNTLLLLRPEGSFFKYWKQFDNTN
jgi:membrane protease subunit HflC